MRARACCSSSTTLPPGVIAGEPAQATLTITNAIRSTGTGTGGGGGGGGGGPSGPSPSLVDFEWNVKRDIEALDAGHGTPSGLWSDGATLWILENGEGADDAIYAYDLESGERIEEREFALHETNRAPRGSWSNGEVVWVSDSGRERVFAYSLATGDRLEEREIALAERNRDARGIWSDRETMWVLDGGKDALFAYDLASGELVAEYALDDANGDPHGIWSDGISVWVSDHGAKRLFAYRLPAPPDAEADSGEEDAGDGVRELERVRDEEFSELSRASNNSPRGIWSDGEVMYVADESDGKVYSYNLPDAIDARLASLTLSGVEFGEFSPGRTDYDGVADDGVAETTVVATTVQRRTSVAIDPPDAGEDTKGHQVTLAGTREVTVTVTSADGTRTRVYRVRLGGMGEEGVSQAESSCFRGGVAVGFSLVVYEGGSVEDLDMCARSRHVTALYALRDGVYVPYILGAPDFVNEAFLDLFTDGLPAVTPLVAGSSGPPAAAPASDGLVGDDDITSSWPRCLHGDIATGLSLLVYEGGSIRELETCARSLGIEAFYVLDNGEFVSYISGAPTFVNRPFYDLFADGLPAVTPLIASSDGPANGTGGEGTAEN